MVSMRMISSGLVALLVEGGKLPLVCFVLLHVMHDTRSPPAMRCPVTASLPTARFTCAIFMCPSLSCANCSEIDAEAAKARPHVASCPDVTSNVTHACPVSDTSDSTCRRCHSFDMPPVSSVNMTR